jgi:hypothetical protein
MKPKNQKEETAIERIIKYSQLIIEIKIIIGTILNLKGLLNHLGFSVINGLSSLDMIIEDLERRRNEIEMAIRQYLIVLFLGRDFGYKEVWALSADDLNSGYILLMENLKNSDGIIVGKGKEWAIPLSDVPDARIRAGELVEFVKLQPYLNRLVSHTKKLTSTYDLLLKRKHSIIIKNIQSNVETFCRSRPY